MSLPVDIVSLVLYCVQQLGVVLGVGAQAVLLVAYLISARDGVIEPKENQFSRVVLHLLKYGLFFIIISGALITVMHLTMGQTAVIFTPAFVFKWALIAIITAITFTIGRSPFMHFFWEGILGAHWSALFLVHTIAPLTTWPDLLVLYMLWLVGFVLTWSALVYSMREARVTGGKPPQKFNPPPVSKPAPVVHQAAPKPVEPVVKHTPPPMPTPAPVAVIKKEEKPIVTAVPHKPEELPPPPLPAIAMTAAVSTPPVLVVPHKPVPQKVELPVPEKPIEDPDKNPGLPAMHIMPRTPQDLDRQKRASIVQFE